MSIPNLLHVVEVAAAEFGPLDSHEACAEFTGYVVPILHELDANIGHLRKDPSRTNYQGRAVDACLYLATGQAIDLLVGSKVASPQSPARPSWQVEEIARYSASDWIKPAGAAPTPEQPTQPEKPAPACKAVESMAEVLDALHEMRIEQAERDEAIRTLLYRLINAERMPRQMRGKAGWMSLSGQVDGVPVE